MKTPEGRVKDKVKAYLDSIGAYYFMPVQTGYGKRTLDFLICYDGQFFSVETKAGSKQMTAQQLAIRFQIETAGGAVLLVNEDNVESLPRLIP